jgi:hypothetical protein
MAALWPATAVAATGQPWLQLLPQQTLQLLTQQTLQLLTQQKLQLLPHPALPAPAALR